jgi:hypothetical protein
VARLLGLDLMPSGGAALEAFALEGNPRGMPFSVPMQRHANCDFSYAGLKTAVRLAIEEHAPEPSGVWVQRRQVGAVGVLEGTGECELGLSMDSGSVKLTCGMLMLRALPARLLDSHCMLQQTGTSCRLAHASTAAFSLHLTRLPLPLPLPLLYRGQPPGASGHCRQLPACGGPAFGGAVLAGGAVGAGNAS